MRLNNCQHVVLIFIDMIILFHLREDSSNSGRSRLGEGLEGRVNRLPEKEFRERNNALRIDNGVDEEGTAGS